MFDRREEINNICTFGPMNIIKAMLETMQPYEVKQIRSMLDPHWSDGYFPILDPYFDKTGCKLCKQSAINRKDHFHNNCSKVKELRNESNSVEEFTVKLWNALGTE